MTEISATEISGPPTSGQARSSRSDRTRPHSPTPTFNGRPFTARHDYMTAAVSAPPAQLSLSQPWVARTLTGLFVLYIAACFLAGADAQLRVTFPAAAVAVAAFLWWQHPPSFLGFAWWVWFLTPLLRRVIDQRHGFFDPNPMLLAPYLVSLVGLASVVRQTRFWPEVVRAGGFSFVLVLTGVCWGFVVGLAFNPVAAVALTTLTWLTPVAFGLHIALSWRDYDRIRTQLKRTFTWGVLAMGCYGIFQFVTAPEWDSFWLENIIPTLKDPSFGLPQPYSIRVWSTMHAPGPFSTVMMAGLLLLLGTRHPLRLPATVAGYMSFLLAMVRSNWIGWCVSVIYLAASSERRVRLRLIGTAIVATMFLLPLTFVPPFSDVIGSRIQTLGSLKQDESYNARMNAYGQLVVEIFAEPWGKGLGGLSEATNRSSMAIHDSGLMEIVLTLGWFGGGVYLTGLLLLISAMRKFNENSSDTFAGASRAIVCGVMIQIGLGSYTIGVPGMVLWTFAGLALAARCYHRQGEAAGAD